MTNELCTLKANDSQSPTFLSTNFYKLHRKFFISFFHLIKVNFVHALYDLH